MKFNASTQTSRELFNRAVERTYYDTAHMELNTPTGTSDGHNETSTRYLEDIVRKAKRQAQQTP